MQLCARCLKLFDLMTRPTLLVVSLLFAFALAAQQSQPTTKPVVTVQEKLGYPASARLLVIHADDFGMAHSVNRATAGALENGWVTSASILVPCPWLPEVARWAQAHPQSDLGIHQALNSEWTDLRWGPVSSREKVPSLLDKQGYLPLLETQVAQQANPAEVETELRAQIDRARSLGITLTISIPIWARCSALRRWFRFIAKLRRIIAYQFRSNELRTPSSLHWRPQRVWLTKFFKSVRVYPLMNGSRHMRPCCSLSDQVSMSSSCTSHMTMTRCEAQPRTILTGEPPGGSAILTWSRALSSGSS